MTQSTLTSKHQTTIPKIVVEALGLKPADRLVYEIEEGGRVILTAKTATFRSVAASLSRGRTERHAHPVSGMKAAVKAMAVKRATRGRS